MRAELSMDMLPILVEQQTYFVAAVMEGKHEKVMELCREGLKGWDRLANSPRSVTVTGRDDVMITPRHASCSCKAYQDADMQAPAGCSTAAARQRNTIQIKKQRGLIS